MSCARTTDCWWRSKKKSSPPEQALEISIETPQGVATLAGSVIQALAGHGVAIRFDASDAALTALTGAAKADDSEGKVTARWHEDGEENAPRAARPTDVPIRERLKTATKPEKIQLALHGSRAERSLLIRDRDKSLHQYVIRNAKLGLDEVATIARMSTVAPDVLAYIAGKREWFQRPEIASAMIRNPKVSAVVAKKLLSFVLARELRQLAKGTGVREAIAQEARRRLLRK